MGRRIIKPKPNARKKMFFTVSHREFKKLETAKKLIEKEFNMTILWDDFIRLMLLRGVNND